MVSRFEKFIFNISEIDRCWHKIASEAMAKYGLKGPYVVYLVAMQKQSQGVTAAQLCEICSRNKADVSRAMSDMISKGLVERVASGDNLYRAELILTEEGKNAAENVSRLAAKAVERGGMGLTDEKRNAFYETLELIAENLQKMSEEGLD